MWVPAFGYDQSAEQQYFLLRRDFLRLIKPVPPSQRLSSCESCQLGKHRRTSFSFRENKQCSVPFEVDDIEILDLARAKLYLLSLVLTNELLMKHYSHTFLIILVPNNVWSLIIAILLRVMFWIRFDFVLNLHNKENYSRLYLIVFYDSFFFFSI